MRLVTSRSFVLPSNAGEMAGAIWFNLWSKRNWPYHELAVGHELVWYETKSQHLRWRTKVERVQRFQYSAKSEVASRLELDINDQGQAYFKDGPASGYCLAYRVQVLEQLADEKPAGFIFPRLGWAHLSGRNDWP